LHRIRSGYLTVPAFADHLFEDIARLARLASQGITLAHSCTRFEATVMYRRTTSRTFTRASAT
jgi:hypothetical protein